MMWDHSFSVVMVLLRLAINTTIDDLVMMVEIGLKDLLQVYFNISDDFVMFYV